jgi:hypothetical protein
MMTASISRSLKRAKAQKIGKQVSKANDPFLKKLAVFENWFRVLYAIALGCSFGHFTLMLSSRSGLDHDLER